MTDKHEEPEPILLPTNWGLFLLGVMVLSGPVWLWAFRDPAIRWLAAPDDRVPQAAMMCWGIALVGSIAVGLVIGPFLIYCSFKRD